MANEARVTSSLSIVKLDANNRVTLQYQSVPGAFTADVGGTKGPMPGSMNVSRNGTDVTLTEVGTPGLFEIKNHSDTYYVSVGVYNPQSLEFYPVLELLPTESFVGRLSRFLGQEYSSPGTGTGTGAEGSVRLRLKAEWNSGTAGVDVFVGVFDR